MSYHRLCFGGGSGSGSGLLGRIPLAAWRFNELHDCTTFVSIDISHLGIDIVRVPLFRARHNTFQILIEEEESLGLNLVIEETTARVVQHGSADAGHPSRNSESLIFHVV